MTRITFAIFFLILSLKSFGADFGLEDLTKGQYMSLIKEMGANTKHSPVSGAAAIGDNKKYEFGLVIGNTQADTLHDIISDFSGDSSSLTSLPYNGFFGAVSLPKNLTGELIYLPEIGQNGVRSTYGSAGLKWTLSKFYSLPVESALRAYAGLSKTTWSQTLSSVSVDVEAKQKTYGLEAVFSKTFGFAEPYLNVGVVKTTGEVSNTGSASIFDSSFTSSNSVEESATAMTYGLGLNLHLSFINFGAETGEAFNNRYVRVKTSLSF